ncbi:MAG TPA: hypothetical protein VFG69_04595 [Nannocystaceae bacterium]|nr:hypothetical protein [Nannocystaceae bacterium]
MPQRNDERKQNQGGPGQRNRDDMQRSPGVDQGQGGQGGGQKMDRPQDDDDAGSGRTGRRDEQE